ncbi:F-box/kelch-repeat protein At3g23880-like [Vicia villosa]|uniref:F-box/kelch-repeat protein At3g23880-like n=1 Tax=Vicia villosa TaxID=3911 RepID=UPI00273C46C2|nr:F-box/kelch-repeat protein At3g23880-like [Vicia villosa]
MNFKKSLMSRAVLPDDLISRILSFLPVKSLLQLRCVCKSWKTLISQPTFIKLHLHQSAKTPQIALISFSFNGFKILPYPIHRLVDNTSSITLPHKIPFLLGYIGNYRLVGSSNGLLCILVKFSCDSFDEIVLYLLNPATRKLSNKIVFLHESHPKLYKDPFRSWKFSFGYDNSTDTYKIVASSEMGREVKVFTSGGDHVWRNIESLPLVPREYGVYSELGVSNSVHVSGSLNWLAIRNESRYDLYDCRVIPIDQFVIVSLDLKTETYRQLRILRGFDEAPLLEPILVVLMDCLCFCHDFHGTDMVIWKMKKFGVEESWTRFIKVSYQSFSYDFPKLILFPLCLSPNGETLVLGWNGGDKQAILYNLRDDRAEKTAITNKVQWISSTAYVESLVSTC